MHYSSEDEVFNKCEEIIDAYKKWEHPSCFGLTAEVMFSKLY